VLGPPAITLAVVSDWELLLLAVLAAVAVAAVITTTIRYVFRGRARLLSGDGGSPTLRAITTVYALSLAFVLATSLQSFYSTLQQTNAEADTVVALGNLSRTLPSPTGELLRKTLMSYANTVITREFPAMESRHFQPLDDDTALVDLYRTMATAIPSGSALAHSATVESIVQQLSNLTTERDARIRAAKSSLPELVWLLIIVGGIIVVLGVAAVTFIDRPWPQFFAVASVSIIFAMVVLIIVSLQTPFVQSGFFVSAEPMKAALKSLLVSAPG
jgi:Protein of unknown function (DUF4239)